MIFVDSWAWIALAVVRDQHHAAAEAQHKAFRQARERYVTTNFALSETISYLYRWIPSHVASAYVENILEGIDEGIHTLVTVSSDHFRQAWLLRQRYHDKPDISFVDLTSMVVMRDLGLTEIFTGDAHFRQVGYRFPGPTLSGIDPRSA